MKAMVAYQDSNNIWGLEWYNMTGFCLFVAVLVKKLRNITLDTMNDSVDRHGNIMTTVYCWGKSSNISIGFALLFSSRTVLSQSDCKHNKESCSSFPGFTTLVSFTKFSEVQK